MVCGNFYFISRGNGLTKPSPAGEGGSRRLTDEVLSHRLKIGIIQLKMLQERDTNKSSEARSTSDSNIKTADFLNFVNKKELAAQDAPGSATDAVSSVTSLLPR